MSLATESEREGRVKRSNLRDKHEDLPPARLLQTSINPKKGTELNNFLMRDSESLGSTSLCKRYSDMIVCIILFMRSMKISVLYIYILLHWPNGLLWKLNLGIGIEQLLGWNAEWLWAAGSTGMPYRVMAEPGPGHPIHLTGGSTDKKISHQGQVLPKTKLTTWPFCKF